MPIPATVTTLQQAASGFVGKPSGSTSRFASVLTDAQVRALLGTGSAGAGAKYLADDSTWKAIDLSGYVPYTGATGAVNLGWHGLTVGGDITLGGGTSSTIGVGVGAKIIFTDHTYISTSRSGSAYGTQHLGGINQGSFLIRGLSSAAFGWGASDSTQVHSPSLMLYYDAAGILAQRNGANAQTFRVYSTYTSATSFENLQLQWASDEARIGTAVGSAGGTQRNLVIGQWNSAGTFTSALSVATSGAITASGNITFTSGVVTSGSPTAFTITGAAHTTLAASTEATDINFNLARTVQFATGALTTQRAMRIQAPTYSAVGASTITTASTLSISGPPVASTNVTITNPYALNVESGAVRFQAGVVLDSYFSTYTWNGLGLIFENRQSVSPAYPVSSSFFTYAKGGDANRGSGLWIGTATDAHFGWVENLGSFITNTRICRDADYIIALRNSTNPFTFRVYNTYTSSTSGEWAEFNWQTTSNVLRIGTNKGSAGGSPRDVAITHGGTVVANFLADRFYLGPITDGTAVGGNARGVNAIDLQTSRGTAAQVASGLSSFAINFGNRASGQYSLCGGYQSSAIGSWQPFAFGSYCIAQGSEDSWAIQHQCNASANWAMASGSRSIATRQGQWSRANGYFAAPGDAQYIHLVVRHKTTNATPVTLFLNGSSARLTIPTGIVMSLLCRICGIKSDGSAVANYVRRVVIKNVGGTTSLVGSVETIGTDHEDNAATDVTITADDTNDALDISVTGIAAETWRWVAVVEGLEIAYGT